jgi:hypothetical protein
MPPTVNGALEKLCFSLLRNWYTIDVGMAEKEGRQMDDVEQTRMLEGLLILCVELLSSVTDRGSIISAC